MYGVIYIELGFSLLTVEARSGFLSPMSRYAVLYGCMLLPLGDNALYCSLRYGFDISSFLSSLIRPDEVSWRHICRMSTSLQAEVGVIKEMVMLREDK